MHALKSVRPDAKGRITLGQLAEGISRFNVYTDDANRIILEPYFEVPANEMWLFRNKTALNAVKQGLKDSAKGDLKERGDFSKYIDEEID